MNLIEHLNNLLGKESAASADSFTSLVNNNETLQSYLANLVEAEDDGDLCYKKDGVLYIRRKNTNGDGYIYTKKEGDSDEETLEDGETAFNNAKTDGDKQDTVPEPTGVAKTKTQQTQQKQTKQNSQDEDFETSYEYTDPDNPSKKIKIERIKDPKNPDKFIYKRDGQQFSQKEFDDIAGQIKAGKLAEISRQIKKETGTQVTFTGTDNKVYTGVLNDKGQIEPGTTTCDGQPCEASLFNAEKTAKSTQNEQEVAARNAEVEDLHSLSEGEGDSKKEFVIFKRNGKCFKVSKEEYKRNCDSNNGKFNPDGVQTLDTEDDFDSLKKEATRQKEQRDNEAAFNAAEADITGTFEEDDGHGNKKEFSVITKGGKTFKVPKEDADAYKNGTKPLKITDAVSSEEAGNIAKKVQAYQNSQIQDNSKPGNIDSKFTEGDKTFAVYPILDDKGKPIGHRKIDITNKDEDYIPTLDELKAATPITSNQATAYKNLENTQIAQKQADEQARIQAEKDANAPNEEQGRYTEDGDEYIVVKRGKTTYQVKASDYSKDWKPGNNDKPLNSQEATIATEKINAETNRRKKEISKEEEDLSETGRTKVYDENGKVTGFMIKTKSGRVLEYPAKEDGSMNDKSEPKDHGKDESVFINAKNKASDVETRLNAPKCDDFEGVKERNGIKIIGKKVDGKYVYTRVEGVLNDDGKYEYDDSKATEINPDQALRLGKAIDDGKSADDLAVLNGTSKANVEDTHATEINPETGKEEIVHRRKVTDRNGKIKFMKKNADGKWVDDPEGTEAIFKANKEQHERESIKDRFPKEMPEIKGDFALVKSEDGKTQTMTYLGKDGNYHQVTMPNPKPNDWKPKDGDVQQVNKREFEDAQKEEKKQRKKAGDYGDEKESYKYLNDDGNTVTLRKFEDGTMVKTVVDKEGNKISEESTTEQNELEKAKKKSKQQLDDELAVKDSNVIPEEFEFNDGEKQVKYKSEKDSDGKIHYYEIGENGEKKEISPETFKKGKELHDKDIERARKLKQDAEDRQLELQKKREDKIIDGKEEKSEPSEFKKSLDTVIDKMMGSDNLIGNLLGGVFKVSLGLMSTITGKMKKKDVGVDAMMLANLQDKLDNVDLTELDDKTKAVLDAVKNQNSQLLGAMYDDNGKLRSPEEIQKALKRNMSDEEWEEYKKRIQEGADATKNIKGVDDALSLPESEEEVAALESKAHKMSAEGKKINNILDKKAKDERESNDKFRDKMDAIAEQRTSEEKSLKNYKNDVDNIQKEIDNIKQEKGESDEQFAGRKKELIVRLEKAQKQYDDASKEVKEKYDKQEEDAIKERQKEREKIEKEYQDAMKEAGFETVEARAEAQAKAKKEKADQEDRESIDKEDEENKKDEKDSEDEEEGEDDPTKEPQNPAKVWKHRKKKNGKGVTANYYNKKGDSISEKEFKEKEAKYQERLKKWQQKQGGTNNESLQDYLSLRLSNDNIARTITISEYLIESQK